MIDHDYGQNDLIIGQRVELSPSCDLWMRGARFGVIVGYGRKPRNVLPQFASRDVIYRVRMDHPQVRRIQRVSSDSLRPIA